LRSCIRAARAARRQALEQAVREFYALFYGVQLSPAQLQALLQAAR
jgi:iron complex transport system substrate-binding protein